MFNMFKILNPLWVIENFLTLKLGGDDPPPAQPTTSTAYNTNIPEYAKPYVTNMLEATQKQLFQMDKNKNITGFQPYNPYSSNMNDYVAGFSPLQQQAQSGAANLRLPGQFQAGSQLAGAGGMGSLGLAGQMANAGNNYYGMATNPYATQAFMNPYLQNALNPMLEESRRQYGMNQTNQMGNATRAGAFGGSREALMASENNRNMNTAMNQMIGQGYNTAFDQAQKNIQYGAGLGLQGQQGALQGYGQGIQAASALGQLGSAQLQGQEGILGLQNQMGAQQQAAEQSKINQAIQNYATAQQYPMMQLGLMSNMTRGLPMQATTTQSYQAQPSALTQGLGAFGTAYGAMKAFGAKGGLPQDFEMRYEEGGVAEDVRSQLENMDPARLEEVLRSSTSAEVKKMAGQILAERKMAEQAMSRGIGAAPSGMATKFAGGGIVAFAGDTDGSLVEEDTRGGYVPPKEAPVRDPLMAENPFGSDLNAARENYMKLYGDLGGSKDDPYAKYGEALKAKLADAEAAKQRMYGESMMQYFTNLGTQPGSVLKAGLTAGRETLPDIIKNKRDFDKEQLGYTAADADLMQKRNAAAESKANKISEFYEKGEEVAGKISTKRIEAAKAKNPTTFTQLSQGRLQLLLSEDPSIRKDPVKYAKAVAIANDYAANKIAEPQMARVGVAGEAVDVSESKVKLDELLGVSTQNKEKQAQINTRYQKENEENFAQLSNYQERLAKQKAKLLDKPGDKEILKNITKFNSLIKSIKTDLATSKNDITDEINSNSPPVVGGGSKSKQKEVLFSDIKSKNSPK
jgi:hypothetical protein